MKNSDLRGRQRKEISAATACILGAAASMVITVWSATAVVAEPELQELYLLMSAAFGVSFTLLFAAAILHSINAMTFGILRTAKTLWKGILLQDGDRTQRVTIASQK